MDESQPTSWRGEPVPIEQWMAGALSALAFALMLARCFWISLLLAIAALILELLALASHGLQRYLGMGPARVAVAIAPGSIRFCIINANLQSHSMISKLAVLPLPLMLTGFSASELSLELQRSFRLQFRASGLGLAVRCREANEWDKVAAAQGAQSAALAQLENLFNIMERRYREEVALTFAAKSDRFGSVKQMVDSIINCVEVKASDFSLKLETMRHTGEETESAEKFLAHIQVGLFHLPAAVPETDPQMPCREVSACEEGESFCPRMQRDISINGFNLNILGAAGAGLRLEEDEAQGQLQDDLFGSMPNMCIRLAMPPVLSHLLSGQRRPWRRISADLTGRGTAAGTLNANEALMKVVWALLGRYLAAGGWAYQLQLAELRAVQGAQNAADGTVLHPQPLTEERRSELLGQLRLKHWNKLKGQLSSWAAGCSYYDLLALRLEAAGCHFQEADGKALWRMALATMDKYSKDEKLFHELHVSMGLSLDINLEMGAAWIHADLGRLFAKLGPKGTQAGLEVVDGVSVDGHARNWHAGGSPSLRARSVLVRGGTKLPAAPNVRPTVHLAVFLPSEPTGMQVKLILNQARARLLPSPLLGTVLPAVLGLLRQDPRPPTPELPDQFIEEHVETPSHQEAPLPDTVLGGMALFVEMDVRNCCAVLPLKPQLPSKLPDIAPDTDLDYDGLVVSAKVIHANLASNLSEESLGLSVEDATVVAPGGYAIMEPMAKVELRYLASWHEPPEGPKAPLRFLTIRLPLASLSVSLAVMRTVKHIATTLAKGFASDEQATAQPSALQEEDQFRSVRRLFLDNDVDNSGELERTEVFKLAERLCVDNYALTHQELIGAFDEIWTVMDSSNNGKVSFEEFCDTLAGDNRSVSNFGPLSVSAVDLKSQSFKEGHEKEDDDAAEERLWQILADDIPEQIAGGGTKSSPLTLQWKLLRALRNYSDAQRFWEDTLRPKVAPTSAWQIEPERSVLPARELIFAALSDSGQIQQITEDQDSPAAPDSAAPAGHGTRTGLKLRMSSEGFRINLEDPLSQLRGQHRLTVGAAMDGDGSGGNGDSSKAFEMEVTYWHVQGRRHLAFEDELKARVAVRGFFSTCMNPFRHDVYDEFGDATPIAQSECPEYIVEPYGFIVLVESGVRAEALTCRFIADTHFVMNVTSSLLLGVKPIVHILMPPEEPDELNDQSNNDLTGTSPLAHLLQGLKHLKQEKLQEFKLLVQDPDGAGVGTTVPNEESLHISTSLTYVLDRRGSDKAKWRIPFSIPSPKNLVRIMLPNVWQITEILQTNASSYELYVEAEAHIDAPVDKDFRVWCVGAASRPSLEEMEEERRSNSPSSAAQEDAPKRRSCQSSRKLQVLNLCGVPTEVWFEKGSKDRLHKKVLEKDPKPMTIEVPINSALCVGLQQVDLYKSGKARPDLSSFGRCGAPLYALQGIMSSTRADQVQCCLTASLSIGQQGQALLELLPPLELQNATQLPLRLHLYPPYGNESVVSQMGILGFTRSSAALATQKLEAKEAVVPPGGTFQVPLHMLYSGSGQNSGFGKHFWQVVAEAISPPQNQCSLTFAFPLGGSILRSGREELELRRSLGLALETTSITGSDPQKTTLQRFTLLLLPGLRIVNSLPVKLRAMLKRDLLADEACDLEPGGIGDFGRSPFQCELFLSVDGEEPQSLKKQMPTLAEALSCRSKFKELKVDQLQLSSNLLCSLQCSWQPGAGPEIVITGKCLVFNKTGLLLQVSDRELLDAPLAPGHAAVLAPEGEVRIGLGTSQSQAGKQKLTAALPERSQDLELRGFADVQDDERLFSWRLYLVKLQHGRLSLLRKRGEADLSSDPPPIIWHLSGHTRCAAAEPQTTGGVKDCFSVEDPGRGQPLVLHAPDATALRDWLSELNQTVQSLQAEETIDKITKGWDQEGGRCRCAKVPELLHGAWCGNGVPIQVSYAGELMASASNPEQPEKPEVMFFGVQVHTVLSIPRFPGKGITVTPRFILRNSSASFVQVMPGLLPNKNSGIQEPAVSNRVAEIVEEHTGGRDRSVMDVMDFIADPKKDEVEAVWVPPGESLAIFHFPLHCEASQAKDGRKAVALRLPGREPLQLISVADKRPLGLQRVLSSGVIPYRDRSMQTGRLPPRMRGLAQEGRLLCYRWFYLQDFDRGELILSSDCEIFIGLPLSVEGATWLHEEPWKPSEGLYLRRKQGDPDIFMKIFTRQMKAGRCNFDGAGKGCVIFLAQRTDNDYDLHMGKGLPWKGWFGLNNTHEEVVALSSGTAGGIYFMRLSVQVRNSTAFMILSDEPAPYRVENWSDSRTLAVRFRGDDYCEILPPLSWFGFDWPAHAKSQQKDWVLMLEDLRTENKAMYEAHKLGPGDDLELEPTAEVTGDTAELTEAGFKKILVKEDQREMERFTRRVAKDLSSSFAQPSLPSELLQDVGTLSEMRQKMIETRLVEPDKPTLTKRGRERAMLCHQMTTNFVKFLLQSGGFNAKENHIAAFVHESHPLPDLLTLLEKLPEEPWVKKEREAGDAFQDLLAMSDVEHTSNVMHMLIRRVLEDMPPVHPKPSKNAVHTVSKHLAETLRNGQWPATVPQWTHFTEEVRLHCLPEERPRDEAAPLEASDDDAEEEERNARPSHLLSSKSDGALDETMVGKTSPLSQDGFVAVQALNSKQAMSAFVKRMLQEERGEVNDLGGFDGFIESCVHDTNLTFRSLHQDIERGPSWALFLKKPGALHVDRCFDGVSRVFTVRDHKMEDGNDRSSTRGKDKGSSAHFECWDIDVQLAGAQICVVFQAQATSLGCGYVNELDEEIFAVTVDHIQLRKKAKERKIKFAVHHFQIDNLREADRQRPIIVCPEDSGYYSDRRETLKHRKNQKETIPFLYFCIEHVPSGILHFKEFELIMQPVITRLDMEFWIEIGQRLLAWISTANSNAAAAVQGLSSEDRQILENQIRNLREGGIDVPSGKTAKRPIYLEKFRLGALIAQVEFLMPMKKTAKILKQRQAAASGSDSATTLEDAEDQFDAQWLQSMWLSRVLARLTYRSHGLMKTILTFAQRVLVFVITSVGSGVLTSLGHVTPRFALPETRIETEFTDLHVFAMNLFQTYVKHGMWESYKVLGSMNILGDPIGWTLSVGGGVKQFFLKTGSDVMTGEFEGEGFKSLVQGVVGGTAAHVGKFFGALGDTVDALTQTGGQNYLPGNVNHVGDGVIVGTQVFGQHVVSGVTGLVAAPIHGFRNKGWRGLGEGFLKGVRGAVAQPVSGLMHGAQHIADGLDATTRLLDHWGQISVRRSARQLQNSQLLPLTGAEFAPRITVWVDALEFLTMESFVASTFATLGQLRGATYRVLLQAGDWSKACKLGHLAPSGAIQFDQAKWVPIETLLESDLDIIVQDCTLQGHLDYDMQIVYKAKLERKFILNQVAKVLQDPEGLAIFKDYTCRWRPSQSCSVRLDPTSPQSRHPTAKLLLRFWPAWDPVRVPKTQQWVSNGLISNSRRAHPERKEGLLLKKSKGLLHHWSEKWVVLENHEFKYWSDRKDCEQQEAPKVVGEISSLDSWEQDLRRIRDRSRKLDFAQVRDRYGESLPLWVARASLYSPEHFPLEVLISKATFKVCYRLADPKCQSRFAAGMDPESYFIQLSQDGEVEAQWQPPDRDQEPVSSWLQAVLRHSILD